MFHHLRRVSNATFAVVLAVMSVNISGVMTVSSAYAANNGTLKVHELNTSPNTESNDPKVCVFNFEGFQFDANQDGLIVIDGQGATPGTNLLSVPFTAGQNGEGETSPYINAPGSIYTLANGHYKSTLFGKDTNGDYTIDLKAKSKVFKVECASTTPDPATTQAPTKATDECGTDNDAYIIPSATGVDYYVDGVLTPANTYNTNGASSVSITAQPQTGYEFQGQQTTSWILTFDTADCPEPENVTPKPPVKIDICDTANDGFQIEATVGVVYKVNNQTVTGFNPATGSVTITAEPASSDYAISNNVVSTWTFTFTDEECEEPCEPSMVTEIPTLEEILNNEEDCEPGMGGGGQPTDGGDNTPSNPNGGNGQTALSLELPQTGPSNVSDLIKIFTIFAAGIVTYGIMYFVVNRRNLFSNQ